MNLFSIPEMDKQEFIRSLVCSDEFRVEHIISQGHRSPDGFWYDQSEHELVCLLSGSALIVFERCQVFLTAGDIIFIPAHKKHRVDATSREPACVWLCIFGHFNYIATQENMP